MLAVKGNQKQLNREVRRYFDAARERDFECEGIENDETAEDGHGRVGSRSCYLSTDLGALSCVKKWNGLRAVGMVESERWNDGRVSIEQRYYVTSLEDVETFGRAVRSHWGIENELHWRLDVSPRRRGRRSTDEGHPEREVEQSRHFAHRPGHRFRQRAPGCLEGGQHVIHHFAELLVQPYGAAAVNPDDDVGATPRNQDFPKSDENG